MKKIDKLLRAHDWWKLKKKFMEELQGKKYEDDDFGMKY